MKVIIADDERLVRAGLKSMLLESDLPVVLMGEAANGAEMVDLVRRFAPDLVFVDIRMPKLDGLAGIKAGRNLSPHTQWIILSGFSEFDYAQEALRLGVVDYLLKPVSPEMLREVLETAQSKMTERSESVNKEFESDVTSLIHGISALDEEEPHSIFHKARFSGAVFTFDTPLATKNAAAKQLDFCRQIRQQMNELSTPEVCLAMITLPSGDLATVCAWGFIDADSGQAVRERYFRKLGQLIEKLRNPDYSVTMFQTAGNGSFAALAAELSQLSRVTPLRVGWGTGRKYALNDWPSFDQDQNLAALCKISLELVRNYQDGAYSAYVQCVRMLQQKEPQMGAAVAAYGAKWRGFIEAMTGCRLPAEEGWRGCCQRLEEYGETLLRATNEKKHSEADVATRAVSYITQNYQSDITVSQIADKLEVTPNYLSALFHKKTGQPLLKYLTEIRMTKAKELLADPNLPIQSVAAGVGYYSARHFAKVFRQFSGCYPSEYRKRLNG